MFKGNQVARLADGFTKLYVLTSLTDVSDKIRPLRQELCTGSLFRAFADLCLRSDTGRTSKIPKFWAIGFIRLRLLRQTPFEPPGFRLSLFLQNQPS